MKIEDPRQAPVSRTTGLRRLLAGMGLGPDARILDIMPRSGGAETTAVLLEQPHGCVDVVAASPASRTVIERAYGPQVGFSPDGLYDLIVVSPTLGDMIEMTRELPWLAERRLKPGGRLLMLTVRPDAIDRKGFEQPAPEVADAFRREFGRLAGRVVTLPFGIGAEFVLEGVTPRNPKSNSYVGWLALRRRAPSDPIRRLKQRFRRARHIEAFADGVVASAPLFGAEGFRTVLQGLADASFLRRAGALATRRRFATVMVSHNDFVSDPRVLRTADAAPGPLLAIGIGETASGAISTTPGGDPLLLLPEVRARIGRRLRLMGAHIDRARLTQLKLASGAACLAWVLAQLHPGRMVLHTHDFQALCIGGAATEALPANRRDDVRWIHDVHEYVRGYDLIDDGVQAVASAWEDRWLVATDALTTVSPELAERLAEHYPQAPRARVILSSTPFDAPTATETSDIRTIYAIGPQPMAIHIGSLRSGRGVEHVIEALARLPAHHLVLVGGGAESYLTGLQDRARALGMRDRVHFHGYQPASKLAGLAAEADVGVISMDSYGNAEVALPNKLFIYIRAGLPVVATMTGAMSRFMSTWPIGFLVPCGDALGLADAIAEAVRTKAEIQAGIRENADLKRAVSWESQALALAELYAEMIRQPGRRRPH